MKKKITFLVMLACMICLFAISISADYLKDFATVELELVEARFVAQPEVEFVFDTLFAQFEVFDFALLNSA